MNVTRTSDIPKTLSPLCFSQHRFHSLRKQDWLPSHMFPVFQPHHLVKGADDLMKIRQGQHGPAWTLRFSGPVSLPRDGHLPIPHTRHDSRPNRPCVLLRIYIPLRQAWSSLPEPHGLREVSHHFVLSSWCCCHSHHITIWFLMRVPSFMTLVAFDPRLKMGSVYFT